MPEIRAQLTPATLPETLRRRRSAGGLEAAAWDETRVCSMPIGFCVRLAASAMACLLATAANAAAQDSVEAFFKGKQIAVVVGSSPGGGYDTYARLLARHFGGTVPGNPTVVVQNMSGAGSNRAA